MTAPTNAGAGAPKSTRRELAHRIAELTGEGMCAREIALALGMSRQRVMKIAAQYGVRLQPRGGSRRISGQFSGRDFAVLQALAAQAGCSPGAMLVRVARITLEEGQAVAARKLGRDALPRRRYTRRG
ncbi:hypothetical protein AA309_20105 [Microvirga vignae]|uniref:Uncharacterized protein n=1 Tax=Microvirga vignae TaxID=1225564 RepID=A0A0H1R994_9HYPH|nr:hypothetical protein [Microvirga vignae]KLK91406.1 hypothetical protein AA309_20105 [Microvirga vignae]